MRPRPLSILALCVALASLAAARQGAAAAEAREEPERFAAVEVLLDAGAEPLAAWQLEWSDPSGRASLVGIEGGDHAAYREPASYDPRALAGGRVVLASFSLADSLPVGETRVATLHLVVSGPEPLSGAARLVAAANPEGRELTPSLRLVPRN